MNARTSWRAYVAVSVALATTSCGWITGRPEQYGRERVQNDLRLLCSALDWYRQDIGRYPSQAEGLTVLLRRGDPARPGGWVKDLPDDYWGGRYRYFVPAAKLVGVIVYSAGPNRRDEGAQGDDLSQSCRELRKAGARG